MNRLFPWRHVPGLGEGQHLHPREARDAGSGFLALTCRARTASLARWTPPAPCVGLPHRLSLPWALAPPAKCLHGYLPSRCDSFRFHLPVVDAG